MKHKFDKRESDVAIANMNISYWKDVLGRNAMLLKVFLNDEYQNRFGDHDAIDALHKMEYAKSMIDHYEKKKERWA